MKYAHILDYVANTPWAIEPIKMQSILAVLHMRAAGGYVADEDIQAAIAQRAASTVPVPSSGAIAVLPIRGVIAHRAGALEDSSGGASTEKLLRTYEALMADPAVSAVVLDVDSPGGAVAGMREASARMQALKGTKRVVAVANSLMASAAYWWAVAADEIVATPSAEVGSIGVFSVHQDISEMLAKEGIKMTVIKAGKFKAEGSSYEPLSDDTRAFIQAKVDDSYAAFVNAVAKGRGVSAADVRNGYGEGRVLSAKEAKAAGLVDRVATMEETLARLSGRKATASLRAAHGEPGLSAEDEAYFKQWGELVAPAQVAAAVVSTSRRVDSFSRF